MHSEPRMRVGTESVDWGYSQLYSQLVRILQVARSCSSPHPPPA